MKVSPKFDIFAKCFLLVALWLAVIGGITFAVLTLASNKGECLSSEETGVVSGFGKGFVPAVKITRDVDGISCVVELDQVSAYHLGDRLKGPL